MLPFFACHNAAERAITKYPARLYIHPTELEDLLVNEYQLPYPILPPDRRLRSQVLQVHTSQNLRAEDILHGWPVQGLFFLQCLILHLSSVTAMPSGCSLIKPKLTGNQ